MKIRPTVRSHRRHARRRGRKDQGWYYHSRFSEGEACRRQVLAVGTGRVLEDGSVRKLDIGVGDRVLFGKYSGTEVTLNGEDHLILREDDILGVVEK